MTEKCSNKKWKEKESQVVDSLSRNKISKDCETWLKTSCPECGTTNWISMSIKCEAGKCFKCDRTFWVSEKIYDDYKTEIIMSQVFDYKTSIVENVFKGLEKPN